MYVFPYDWVVCPFRRSPRNAWRYHQFARFGVGPPAARSPGGRKGPSTGLVDPAKAVPLPVGHLAVVWEQFRSEVRQAISAALAASAAPGTVRTFAAVLRRVVTKMTGKLGAPAIPMVSEPAFFGFFASALLVRPHSPSSAPSQLAVRWSYVRLVEAALAFWRSRRNGRVVFDKDRSLQMGAPWSPPPARDKGSKSSSERGGCCQPKGFRKWSWGIVRKRRRSQDEGRRFVCCTKGIGSSAEGDARCQLWRWKRCRVHPNGAPEKRSVRRFHHVEKGAVYIRVACPFAIPSCGNACSAKIIATCSRFRGSVTRDMDRDGGMAVALYPVYSTGLARAELQDGLAPAGTSAATREVMAGAWCPSGKAASVRMRPTDCLVKRRKDLADGIV